MIAMALACDPKVADRRRADDRARRDDPGGHPRPAARAARAPRHGDRPDHARPRRRRRHRRPGRCHVRGPQGRGGAGRTSCSRTPQHPYTIGLLDAIPPLRSARDSDRAPARDPRPRARSLDGLPDDVRCSRRAAPARTHDCVAERAGARAVRRPGTSPRASIRGGRRERRDGANGPALEVIDLVKRFTHRQPCVRRAARRRRARRRRRVASSSRRARCSGSSASRAAASRRSANCVLRLIEPTAGTIRLRGTRHHPPVAPRAAAAPARAAHRLPGPVLVAQPADDGRARSSASRCACTSSPRGASGDARVARAVRRGRPAARAALAATRTSSPAGSASASASPARCRVEPSVARRRRAGVGARRLGAGVDPQPARATCRREFGLLLPLHHPRPGGRRAPLPTGSP